MTRILMWATGVLAALVGFFKLKADNAKAEATAAKKEAQQSAEVIENVKEANHAVDRLNDPDEYQRMLNKYTRKE